MGDVVHLKRNASDVDQAMEMLNKLHAERGLVAMIVTHWTKDGHLMFTSVGEMDGSGPIMEAVGTMEHHKNFLLNLFNATLIAKANQLASEYDDGRRAEDDTPDAPA